MGEEVEELLAGTAGKGSSGGKRFVGSFTKSQQKRDPDLVKKFGLGAGTWSEHATEEDSVLSNVSQPSWVKVASDTLQEGIHRIEDETLGNKIKLIERLRKEMNTAASRLEFERAAKIRDRIIQLENEFIN
jgi:excinuclease UvrABC nuclease subunit